MPAPVRAARENREGGVSNRPVRSAADQNPRSRHGAARQRRRRAAPCRAAASRRAPRPDRRRSLRRNADAALLVRGRATSARRASPAPYPIRSASLDRLRADRKSVVEGRSVAVRGDSGGRRIIKQKIVIQLKDTIKSTRKDT